MRDVRAYQVTVQGFPPMLYSARTPAKARARAYYDYISCFECDFKYFLRNSSVRRAPWADAQHQRRMVHGKPATIIIHPHRRDMFMYDGSDVVMVAHHSEIQPMPEAA